MVMLTMRRGWLIPLSLVVLLCQFGSVRSQGAPIGTTEIIDPNMQVAYDDQYGGYRLPHRPYFFITAPRRIRPGQTIPVSVTILRMDPFKSIKVRVWVIKDGHGFCFAEDVFKRTGTRILRMYMPPNSEEGIHYIRAEGFVQTGISKNDEGRLFFEEQPVLFYQKQVSVFIQTDKPIYRQSEWVHFRVICVKPNLMPQSGTIEVYLKDPKGFYTQRWRGQQTNMGIVEQKFQISDRPQYGTWHIEVNAFGFEYEQPIVIEEFWRHNFEVNVSSPAFMHSQGFALVGSVYCNFTAGVPIRGNAMLTACVRDDPVTLPRDQQIQMMNGDGNNACTGKIDGETITRKIDLFWGSYDFVFTMQEISKASQIRGAQWKNKQIVVHAKCFDKTVQDTNEGQAITNVYHSRIELSFLGDQIRSFKPRMPFHVYVAVQSAFGSPIRYQYLQNVTFRIESQSLGSKVVIVQPDGDSIAHVEFVPDDKDQNVKVKAHYADFTAETIEMRAMKYQPSLKAVNSFIQITSTTLYPRVDEYMVFTVKTADFVDEVHYQIVANGEIVTAETLAMTSTQSTFAVALSTEMAASAHILAYYFHPSGEVIVDGMNFFVNGTASNDVHLKFNHGKDFTQHSVEVIAQSEPTSLIAFQAVDRELFLRSGGYHLLTETDILEELATYDDHSNSSFRHTWIYPDMSRRTFFFNSPTYGFDANTTFTFAGLLVFTDANVSEILHPCNWTLGMMPCYDNTCFDISQLCDGVFHCKTGVDEMGCPQKRVGMGIGRTPWLDMFSRHMRHYDESSFLWQSMFTKSYGQTEFTVHVPIYPHTWMVTAFSMSPTTGLGVPTVPTIFSGVRPFFIVVEAPDRISLGEQIGIRVAIFNYWSYYVEAVVRMHQSDDYDYVKVKEFGSVSSYAPKTANGNLDTMVWLTPGMSTFIFMPCLPRRLGNVDIAISVYSFLAQYSRTVTVRVVPNSIREMYHTSYLADLSVQGGRNIPDFEIPVAVEFLLPDKRYHSYVPGSQAVQVNFVGDVYGASIADYPLSADNSLFKPQGCAEMNMFNFAINVYSMKYLKAINQLDFKLRRQTFNYLYRVMQRQVGYMSEDGAFSMAILDNWQYLNDGDAIVSGTTTTTSTTTPFPGSPKPPVGPPPGQDGKSTQRKSVWLTAFILESLLSAMVERDWQEEFFVSSELVNKVAEWLCKQQLPNGAFKEWGVVYDRKMTANSTSQVNFGDSEDADYSALTAYVLISLRHHSFLTGDARTGAANAWSQAREYLEQRIPIIEDPFDIAIVAYALHLTNSAMRNNVFYKLQNARRPCHDCWYWGTMDIAHPDEKYSDTRAYYPYHDPSPIKATAVQATSYALMVYLMNSDTNNARRIMAWLQTQRGTAYGFASTQDTLVALQALSEYAQGDPTRTLFNMNMTIYPQIKNSPTYQLSLYNDDYATARKQDIDPEHAFLSLRMILDGVGWGLIQMSTRKNVEFTALMRQPLEGDWIGLGNFNESLRFSGFNSSVMAMRPCVNFLQASTLQPRTGMVVLVVNTPSSYIALNDSLMASVRDANRELTEANRAPVVRWAEYYDNKVVFYFDFLERDRVCVDFSVFRLWPVANITIHHKVVAYEYYAPARWTSSLYEVYSLFNLDICKVCGSFTCPYCPFYNGGPSVFATFGQVFVVMMLSLTVSGTFYQRTRRRFSTANVVT